MAKDSKKIEDTEGEWVKPDVDNAITSPPSAEPKQIELKDLIKGSNGMYYRQLPSGDMRQVFIPAVHAKKLIEDIKPHHRVTSVRVLDPTNLEVSATLVQLNEEEAEKVTAFIVTEILTKRAEGPLEVPPPPPARKKEPGTVEEGAAPDYVPEQSDIVQ
jgi:hypothetical protein